MIVQYPIKKKSNLPKVGQYMIDCNTFVDEPNEVERHIGVVFWSKPHDVRVMGITRQFTTLALQATNSFLNVPFTGDGVFVTTDMNTASTHKDGYYATYNTTTPTACRYYAVAKAYSIEGAGCDSAGHWYVPSFGEYDVLANDTTAYNNWIAATRIETGQRYSFTTSTLNKCDGSVPAGDPANGVWCYPFIGTSSTSILISQQVLNSTYICFFALKIDIS